MKQGMKVVLGNGREKRGRSVVMSSITIGSMADI